MTNIKNSKKFSYSAVFLISIVFVFSLFSPNALAESISTPTGACGAESALVVNNCASAVLLVIAALAEERGVAVSRSELVEIGGGFRIPEIIEQSGAHLVEVGTTNRTRRKDFSGKKT